MFKKSVVALALFAAVITGSQAFAADQIDLVMSAPRLKDMGHVEVTLVNRGSTLAKACESQLGIAGSGLGATITLGCTPLAAGESKTLVFNLPQAVSYQLSRWRFERITGQSSHMVFLQLSVDTKNEVYEKFDVKVGSLTYAYDGEINNSIAFTAIP